MRNLVRNLNLTKLNLARLLKWVYPYWVVGRVLALVLGSLIFLVLHEAMRQVLNLSKSPAKPTLNYADRGH